MPRIVDYPDVLQQARESGLVSLYHNAGAFGFAGNPQVHVVGWIEADDPSIRQDAMSAAHRVASVGEVFPHALRLLPGEVWLTPKSHWHYELHFGNRELLEPALATIDIDAAALRERNDGSAIAFEADERELLCDVVKRLAGELSGSDFLLTFAGARTLCTIHHHRQLWWQTLDPVVAEALKRIAMG